MIGDFSLIPLHTMASDAIKEIDKLYDVFEEIKMKWNTEVRHDNYLLVFPVWFLFFIVCVCR